MSVAAYWPYDEIYRDDPTSDTGVLRIKGRIERYWRERGYHVDIQCKRIPFKKTLRIAPLVLVSDMRNGLPRELYEQRLRGGK